MYLGGYKLAVFRHFILMCYYIKYYIKCLYFLFVPRALLFGIFVV